MKFRQTGSDGNDHSQGNLKDHCAGCMVGQRVETDWATDNARAGSENHGESVEDCDEFREPTATHDIFI